jgi:hypothetical protein
LPRSPEIFGACSRERHGEAGNLERHIGGGLWRRLAFKTEFRSAALF